MKFTTRMIFKTMRVVESNSTLIAAKEVLVRRNSNFINALIFLFKTYLAELAAVQH